MLSSRNGILSQTLNNVSVEIILSGKTCKLKYFSLDLEILAIMNSSLFIIIIIIYVNNIRFIQIWGRTFPNGFMKLELVKHIHGKNFKNFLIRRKFSVVIFKYITCFARLTLAKICIRDTSQVGRIL